MTSTQRSSDVASPIRVGIIGANPNEGWARGAHVPAIAALPGLELAAVATTREETARAGAEQFGARHAFADTAELARHPEVDLVVVAVKVPAHDDIVRTAIEAGKPVLCEWPLARDTAEAEALAQLARERGVRAMVSLQGRFGPGIQHARRLIDDGYVGRVTSVRVAATLPAGVGAGYVERQRYRFDPANGATVFDIVGGHTLDTVGFLAGELATVSAEMQTQHTRVRFVDSGEELAVETPDHVMAHGRLHEGAAFSLFIASEQCNATRTVIEVAGTEGDLRLETGEKGLPGVQLQDVRVLGARGRGEPLSELPPAAEARWVDATLTQPALNVAQLYARLAADLREGSTIVPDFERAVHVHRLLETLEASAADGGRMRSTAD
jgi:predicted dehydrogenase